MSGSWKISRWVRFAAVFYALATAGCASVPSSGIDPTGERIFATPPAPTGPNYANERFFDEPLGQLPWDDVAVQLRPRRTVAPVGSEVVLIAGVCGPDGYLRTNRRLEWSIDAGSVGQFVAVGENGLVDLLLGDFNRPRKITNTLAVGSTSRSNIRLNRGTCRPEDAVNVLRGEGWISLTSPAEGVSHVTVIAPEVYRWDARLQSAVVHWVDAQWRFPPPAISPAGSRQALTTVVTRQTSQAPCERWLVRYTVEGGPPAGFMPDGSQSVEVPTDSNGQATVEIFQKEAKHGTNKICIEVARPADVPGAGGQRLTVGSGATMVTWTAADLEVKISGPTTASPGSTVSYHIDVLNPGDLGAKDVVAACELPDGMTLLGSNPAAESTGGQLLWRLGELSARQRRGIDVQFRAEKQGPVNFCCEATAAGNLKARDCLSANVGATAIDVRISGPSQATLGSEVVFEITVRNLGQSLLRGLIIKDRLDPGLEHPAANQQNVIERSLGELAAGQAQVVKATFRANKPGRLCHTVEVSGAGVTPVSAQACLTVTGGDVTTTPPPVALAIKNSGPGLPLVVGEKARFTIDLSNTGNTALKTVKVVHRHDAALLPSLATGGYVLAPGSLTWNVDELPAGKTVRIEVHYTCQTVATKACTRATAIAADGGQVEDEACFEIRAPSSESPETTTLATPQADDGLNMSVVGLTQPVAVGKELTYVIRVTNTGSQSHRQLTLTAAVPEGLTPVPLRTVGPGATKFVIEGRSVKFDSVFELQPNESLEYRVRVLAKQPGNFQFRAELSTPALPQPLVQETTTEVVQPRQ